MRLAGKVALVTGGSRGIGRAVCVEYAREGATVAVNYASNSAAAEDTVGRITSEGGEAFAVQADVSDKAQVDAMVGSVIDRCGRIDTLVNNAGVGPFIDFFECDEETWDRTQAINCKGIFLVSQAVARHMRGHGGGHIVNVTSISGLKATNPLQVPYCTSKGGANMLTKIMAVALAPYNITVNAILPGTIETDINRAILNEEGVREGIIDVTPLRALGLPEQIAHAAVLLGSDESNWTTGSLLVVDGGFIA